MQFSEDNVTQLLLESNVCKPPGPDNIHPRVLKECAKELTLPLFLLFKKSLSAGRLPAAWKEGHVTPIFKKESRSDVGNYRPVTLMSVCCKTMEKLTRDALMKHMNDCGYLSDTQHGFIKGRSCTAQLLE